jgi:hypothetical protein
MLPPKFPLLVSVAITILAGHARADVVLNEIYYDAEPNTSASEFIELHNSGAVTVDLSGWYFTNGIEYTFPPGSSLVAGGYLVIAEQLGGFASRFPVAPAPFGTYLGGLSNLGERMELVDNTGLLVDRVEYGVESPWPVGANGGGVSLELIHPSLDNNLSGSWRSANANPTPGGQNSVFATNAPPQTRQIDHSPKQPVAGQATVITAKATDPDGVQSMVLQYQLVAPGAYIPAYTAHPTATLLANPTLPNPVNPDYTNSANWIALTMVDDGTSGDAVAGDQVFTATIPGQANRTLVRYRIVATDSLSVSVRLPYADDPSLNFAYFTYNGVPDYVAGTRSVTGIVPTTHPKEVLTSIPVYQLICKSADYTQAVAYNGTDQIPSNNFDARSAFNWTGSFVYNGKVYDNIRFRLRQRNARYAGSGKRSFRFRFNTGNYVQFHDMEGNPYPQKWRTLNSHKMDTRGGYSWGLYEATNNLLWNMTGTPAPNTQWFHFRVIDQPEEAPAGANGQNLGDFYGLMLGMENYDVRFLDSHNLERGNLYRLKSYRTNGLDVQRYQAASAVTDASDFGNIINNLRPARTDQWLLDYVDYDAWYRYHSVVDAVRHYDVAPNTGEHLKNRAYYFRPDPLQPLGKLNVLPWDSDTSWGPNWNGGLDFCKDAMGARPDFNRDYRNVVRELRDLFWQEDQIKSLLDYYQYRLSAMVTADRDRWTGSPASAGSQTNPSIEAIVADMKKFAFVGGSWVGGNDPTDAIAKDSGISGQQGRDAYLDALAGDAAVPAKPTITYTGPAGFPVNGLNFQSSAFSDPQGAGSFGAMEWRVAEYTPYVEPGPPPPNDVVFPLGSVWKYDDTGADRSPSDIVDGHPSYDAGNWKNPAFDDAGWSSGAGQLGYGESGLGTTINNAPHYFTYYFRRTFNVQNVAQYASFLAQVIRDDGAIVYVNGKEAGRTNMDPGVVFHYDTVASVSSAGNDETNLNNIVIPVSYLVEGTNTIAVEVHQFTLGSSDVRFDLSLEAVPTVPMVTSLPKFEWVADWESGELTSFSNQVSVPTLATRAGSHYRARVRYRDNTNRWSAWSAPVEFVASVPDLSVYLDHLIISELMFDPPPVTPTENASGWTASDFEWIELQNVSPGLTLDLTDLRFTKGIDFDIPPGTMLAPGQFALVVANQAAFESRYGAGLNVIGAFASGKLDNAGERLKLSFGAGEGVRDFNYATAAPWPTTANGTGHSIELILPFTHPDHGVGSNWRASLRSDGGTPGVASPSAYDYWAAQYFDVNAPDFAALSDPSLDGDGDGMTTGAEYAFGSRPDDGGSVVTTTPTVFSDGAVDYLAVVYVARTDDPAITYAPEGSDDLESWVAGQVVEVSSLDNGDGTRTVLARDTMPVNPAQPRYLRVRASWGG